MNHPWLAYIWLHCSVKKHYEAVNHSRTLGRLGPHVLKQGSWGDKKKNFVTGMTIKVFTVESEHFQAMKSR